MSRKTKRKHQGEAPKTGEAPWDRLAAFLRSHKQETYIFLALVFACLLVFGQTRNFDFVNLDDDANVYNNPVVQVNKSFR